MVPKNLPQDQKDIKKEKQLDYWNRSTFSGTCHYW